MLINLIAAWKNVPRREIVDENQNAQGPMVAQSSFQFEVSPTVVFVKDIHALSRAHYYRDLPVLPLQPLEKQISIIARKDKWRLRSVAAGFLECEKGKLHPLDGLILKTAYKETNEEFVLDTTGYRRIDFTSLSLTSISFYEAINMEMTPTIEFIVPLRANHDADYIQKMMNHNTASHAHEHIANSAVNIPLDSDKRVAAARFTQGLPGSFLYGPVMHTCAHEVHTGMTMAARMEGIPYSRFYSMRLFKPAPQKALTDPFTQHVMENTHTP